MDTKKNPDSLNEVNSLKIDYDIKTYVNKLRGLIDEEKNYRVNWENAIDRLDRLRYGIRPRKVTPWPNCANHSMPLIDSDISRLKPSYVNLTKVTPIAIFEPFGPEDVEPARKREMLHDWRMRNKVNFFKPFCYGVDQILGAPGQTVFRIVWKFSTRTFTETIDLTELDERTKDAIFDPRVNDDMLFEIIRQEYDVNLEFDENEKELRRAIGEFRKGKQVIDMKLLEVKDDQPEIIACNVKDDLVVPRETKDINDARFIDYKLWVTKNDLKIAMQNEKYHSYSDDEIQAWMGKSAENSKQGYQNKQNDLVLLHETCCWYDINDDGIDERCITTWPDANPEAVLRFIELPYEHGMWPYVQVKRELTEDSFFSSRGVPYLDEDFQVAISTAINQAIDNGTLLNTPERVARKGVLSNPRNRRYIPGELTEVNGSLADYETRQQVNSSQPVLLQQAQYFKAWSSERFGQVTNGLSSQVELAGMGQGGKKTASEINALMSMQGDALSLDLVIFQEQFKDVHYQIDALYWQFGAAEEEIITGDKPVKVSREEIQGKFNIVPNGRFDNSNPIMRLKKTMSIFQVGMNNQFVKQDELIKLVLRDIDEKISVRLMKSKEDIMQEQNQGMQMKEMMENANLQKQFQVKKVSDDLEVRKAALLAPIEGRQFAPG